MVVGYVVLVMLQHLSSRHVYDFNNVEQHGTILVIIFLMPEINEMLLVGSLTIRVLVSSHDNNVVTISGNKD